MTQIDKEALKPCPFCGGEASIERGNNGSDDDDYSYDCRVGCIDTPCDVMPCALHCTVTDDNSAIRAWNTRAHLEHLDQTGDRGAALDALTYIRGMVERANGTILEGSAVDSMFKSIERCVAPDHAEELVGALKEAVPFIGWTGSYPEIISRCEKALSNYETKKGGA